MKSFCSILALSFIISTCEPKKSPTSESFLPGVSKGILDNGEIKEASGIASSKENPHMFWTHNDSGNKPELFLIDANAKCKTTVFLSGIKNRDWEDIAVGPGPMKDRSYIYVGDIGDNSAQHEIKFIYRFIEPKLYCTTKQISISEFDTIKFSLPDGIRDTESLMIDPLTKNIYIISKREPKEVHVYKLPFPQSTTEVITAALVLKIPYTFIVAGDISADGSEVLIKSYSNIYYWKKKQDESIEELLKTPASILPYETEAQGEAITFDRVNEGYYTLSEEANMKKPHLMFYKRIAKDVK